MSLSYRELVVRSNKLCEAIRLEGHTDEPRIVTFSPDGQMVASATRDHKVKVWQVATGQTVATLRGHSDQIRTLSFSPDGQWLASGGDDGSVRLWNMKNQHRSLTLDENAFRVNEVNAVAFLSDGRRLAVVENGETLRLLDTTTWLPVFHLGALGSAVSRARVFAFSPDSRLMADTTGHHIQVWDMITWERIWLLSENELVRSMTFSSDGELLACGDDSGRILLYKVRLKHRKGILLGHSGAVNTVAISPHGRLLASACADGTLRLWDLLEEAQVWTASGTKSPRG